MSCEFTSFQSLFAVLPIAAVVSVFRLTLQSLQRSTADRVDGEQTTAEVIIIQGCAYGQEMIKSIY